MRRRRGSRATLAGLATTGALVAAVAALGVFGTGYVAFEGWPGTRSVGGADIAVTSPSPVRVAEPADAASIAADAAPGTRAAVGPLGAAPAPPSSSTDGRPPSADPPPRARAPLAPEASEDGQTAAPLDAAGTPTGAGATDDAILVEAVEDGSEALSARIAELGDGAADGAETVSPALASPVAETGSEAASGTRETGRTAGAVVRRVTATATLP